MKKASVTHSFQILFSQIPALASPTRPPYFNSFLRYQACGSLLSPLYPWSDMPVPYKATPPSSRPCLPTVSVPASCDTRHRHRRPPSVSVLVRIPSDRRRRRRRRPAGLFLADIYQNYTAGWLDRRHHRRALPLLPLGLPSVVSRQSSVVSRQSSVVSRQSSVVSRQPSVVSRQPSAVSRQSSVVSRQSSVVSRQSSVVSR